MKIFMYFGSVVLSTLFLNSFFWGLLWLIEKPFDILGWLRIYVNFLDYSHCEIRLDYFIQSLLLIATVALHLILIYAIKDILKSIWLKSSLH